MENIGRQPIVYWNKKVPDTNLEKLQKIIERKHNVKFESYWDLHKWSIQNYAKFIEELWHFFEIISSEPYKEVWVKTGPDFLDNKWFSGARLNYAENMLRLRDDSIALICLGAHKSCWIQYCIRSMLGLLGMIAKSALEDCYYTKESYKRFRFYKVLRRKAVRSVFELCCTTSNIMKFLNILPQDVWIRIWCASHLSFIYRETLGMIAENELGNKEIVTYSDMYEEVKLYAAAFRENGLKKGDSVACFMSNRKEAIFAMLAAASIGATWGGPVPYYGAQAASNIVNRLDPKFLIAIDSHQDNGIIFPTLNYLPEIVKNAPTIERTILVVTQEETRKKDLSNIRNCVFLEDFLQEGRDSDGNVPELVFEQLPFDYPLCVNFTSGTTGLPKAPVHSIGSMMAIMQNHSVSHNLKKGDVIFMNFPVGWTLWDSYIPCLGLGLTIFMYCGSNYYTVNGKNFWDLVAEFHCKKVNIITSQADKMEKLDIIPRKGTDMSCLKVITIGGSPVKNHNLDYIKNKVNKDTFVVIIYGASEMFGSFSGFNMNMPVYGGEIQTPALGQDLQCFDSEGKSVVGKYGETVICSPVYNLPTHLWKDVDKTKITDIYLKKFPGVWAQHDACWINPKTKGLVLICRSDETLKQKGERFGAADIYFAIHSLDELQDYICVPQQKYNGDSRAVLFVKMRPGLKFTPEIRDKIEKRVDEELWEDCVPELIVEVPEIPYNLNNKRMESLVQKIIAKNEIPEVMNIRNPECLRYYVNIPEILSYNKH